MQVLVNITADHIQRGRRYKCRQCPAALAMLDALPPGCHVEVGVHTCNVWMPDGTAHRNNVLPLELQETIREYDETGKMHPCQFTVTIFA